MKRYIWLYWHFLIQQFKTLMEYRLNFFVGATSYVLNQAAGIAAVWVIMIQVPSLNGWSLEELLLIYGLLTASRSLEMMFADNLWVLGGRYIQTGAFDRFLVRPINPLFHLLADRFNHEGIGNLIVGLALIGTSWVRLGINTDFVNSLYLIVAVLSGGVIFSALNLITATLAFWTIENLPFTKMVHDLHEFAKYPLSMYHPSVQIGLTWLIPFGFASFYPASYLLGKEVTNVVWLGPLVAGTLALLAYRIWLFGLRHYASTGT